MGMRILYVITRAQVGGAQVHLLDLVRGFSGDNEIGVIAGESGYLADEAARSGAQVFIVPQLLRSPMPHLDVSATARILKIIRAYRPDFVHCHTSKAGLLGRLAARLAGVPSIYTVHGWRFAPRTKLSEKLVAYPGEWLGAHLGSAIIVVSNYERDLASRCHIPSRLTTFLVHNGVQDCSLRARPAQVGDVNLVMVARFADPKDQLSVVRAFATLPGNARLWFVGDGPNLPRVKAEAGALGLEDKVVFYGNRTNVSEILAAAHIFVLVSAHEGLSISVLEALRAGLPVVASEVGGMSDCVQTGHSGFTVPYGDMDRLRISLATLIESPSLRESMGKRGRQVYAEHFTSDLMVAKTLDVYRQLGLVSPAAPSE